MSIIWIENVLVYPLSIFFLTLPLFTFLFLHEWKFSLAFTSILHKVFYLLTVPPISWVHWLPGLVWWQPEFWGLSLFFWNSKAYDTMDRGRCLDILAGYGVGPKLIWLLTHFCTKAKLACCTGGYYGAVFSAGQGVTQGGPLSPRIFNVVVDAVIWEWLCQLLGKEVARHGLGDLAKAKMVAFYAGDGVLLARCPERLQEAFSILVSLFKCVSLSTNAQKTKVMTSIPGKIRVSQPEEVCNDYCQGASTHAARKQLRVECDICNQSMQVASLCSHLESQHDVFRSFVLNRDLERELSMSIRADVDTATGLYDCPVPNCPGGASTLFTLRKHFIFRHPQHLVVIPQEGLYPYPWCPRCHMQTSAEALNWGHQQTMLCKGMYKMRLQHEAATHSQQALQQDFFCGGDKLERVEVFKYLGQMLAYDDNDTQAMQSNLKKSQRCWARIWRVLRAENATPQVSGVFYKVTMMAVLLIGSETWSLAPSSLKSLEGFQIRAAWHVAGKGPWLNQDRSWTYPDMDVVMKEVGLRSIAHCVEVWQQHIFNYIVNRPIFNLCQQEVTASFGGTSQYQWWTIYLQEETMPPMTTLGHDSVGSNHAGFY